MPRDLPVAVVVLGLEDLPEAAQAELGAVAQALLQLEDDHGVVAVHERERRRRRRAESGFAQYGQNLDFGSIWVLVNDCRIHTFWTQNLESVLNVSKMCP